VVVNGGVRAQWKKLEAFVTVNNLLNNAYETFGTFAPNAKAEGAPVERFLTPAGIYYRLDVPTDLPAIPIQSQARHHFLLAVKETLNNAVRHGRATEVLFRLTFLEDKLEILIKDNGRGFDQTVGNSGNGLTNLHERMRSMNGSCEVESSPGHGATISLSLPLVADVVAA